MRSCRDEPRARGVCDQRIAQLYQQGYSPRAIAGLFRVPASVVRDALARQHVELRSRAESGRLARALTREQGSLDWDKRVAHLYEQDNSTQAIGRLLDISAGSVYKALKRQHVELRSMTEAVVLAKRSPVREQLLAEAGACGSPQCTDPECSVAPGYCHRPDCPNKAATQRGTDLDGRTVKGLPSKYCSQDCFRSVRAVELPVGRCGSPTCTDDRCSVPPGHCHRPGCDRPAAISQTNVRAYRWLKGYPKLYCTQACMTAHVGADALVKAHARERATLESEGLVPAVKAARLSGLDPRAASQRLEPLLDVDVERRKFGRRVKQGVNAREVLRIAPTDKNARGKLQKPLGVLNGTEQFGRQRKLSAAEIENADALSRDGLSTRKIAAALNERRSPEDPVTHNTVARAMRERRAATVEIASAPL
jgi:transposase